MIAAFTGKRVIVEIKGIFFAREKMKVAVLCLVMALVVVIKATPIEKDEQMKIETRGE